MLTNKNVIIGRASYLFVCFTTLTHGSHLTVARIWSSVPLPTTGVCLVLSCLEQRKLRTCNLPCRRLQVRTPAEGDKYIPCYIVKYIVQCIVFYIAY